MAKGIGSDVPASKILPLTGEGWPSDTNPRRHKSRTQRILALRLYKDTLLHRHLIMKAFTALVTSKAN
jgi:hypothetical protein